MTDEPGVGQSKARVLITEVPASLRGQSAPTPSPREVMAVPLPLPDTEPGAAAGVGPDPGPEERTRVRTTGQARSAGAPSPLRQPTGATVPAVWCPAGHFSPPAAPYCRSCGAPIPAQQPMRVPRPTLGTLQLPEGDRVELDRAVVLGRRPAPLPDGEPWPHLVELPAELTHLSRNHVAIELDGWHVLARDLGSSGGTALHAPGRPPVRLRPHDPHVLEPGQALVLSGDFTMTFVVTVS